MQYLSKLYLGYQFELRNKDGMWICTKPSGSSFTSNNENFARIRYPGLRLVLTPIVRHTGVLGEASGKSGVMKYEWVTQHISSYPEFPEYLEYGKEGLGSHRANTESTVWYRLCFFASYCLVWKSSCNLPETMGIFSFQICLSDNKPLTMPEKDAHKFTWFLCFPESLKGNLTSLLSVVVVVRNQGYFNIQIFSVLSYKNTIFKSVYWKACF